MKNSIKTIFVSILACCALVSVTGCSAAQETAEVSTPSSSVSSQIEETEEDIESVVSDLESEVESESGEITLESYLNADPDVMEMLQGNDEGVTVEVSGNTIRYTYQFSEDMLTGDEAMDQEILDSVMESMGDSFQVLTDDLADSTGLPVQMDVIYENADGDTVGSYSYVSAEINDLIAETVE